ncbi:MAG: ATP-grasp domain-containing protein [Candidatus Lokiarchaeota archaeon]|nr:ATP-grasp domain-containing protein [Candidatus Lokiarchaeota archaeon]
MEKSLFVFEFISGGGLNKSSIPSSLFCEGFGMMRAIINDFKRLGFKISTLLDNRIRHFQNLLDVDLIFYINSNMNYISIFKNMVKKNEFCFIVAPESSEILKNLTEIVKINNKKLLSIDIKGIEIGTYKYKTYKFFKKNKLETPKTFKIPMEHRIPNKEFIISKYNIIQSPIIIKPDDGVGAESIIYISKKDQIKNILAEKLKTLDIERNFLLQEYVNGESLSLSLMNYYSPENNEYRTKILSINTQKIALSKINNSINYLGGYTPYSNYKKLYKKVSEILNHIKFCQFNGLFGIDFIQNKHKISFIEINPRITTSYLGLRNVLNRNPADLIVRSKSNIMDDDITKIENNSVFLKFNLINNGNLTKIKIQDDFNPELLKLFPEFIVPPISLDNKYLSCFIVTKEKSLEKSLEKVEIIKNYLLSKDFVIY